MFYNIRSSCNATNATTVAAQRVRVVFQLINEKNVGHIPMIQSCEYTQSEE